MNNGLSSLRVAVAGTGWRAEFFMRAAIALPERFQLVGILYHSEESREKAKKWKVPLVNTYEELAKLNPDFVCLAVNGDGMREGLNRLNKLGIPVLCETFVMKSAQELNDLYSEIRGMRLQFAEQYQFQPLNAARLRLARSGKLGKVYQVHMSIPTRHHPASLVRLFLDAGFRLPVISGKRYMHSVLRGPSRAGDPVGETEFSASHELIVYDYGDAQAINDFEDMQHRSFMRANYFLVRGSRGEIANEHAVYMKDELTPCEFELNRVTAGAGVDLQGLFLRGVSGGQDGWLYENEFMPARLYDDELAVASCMSAMARYIETGEQFYGLEEELTDMYFALLTGEAVETGRDIQAKKQSWMD